MYFLGVKCSVFSTPVEFVKQNSGFLFHFLETSRLNAPKMHLIKMLLYCVLDLNLVSIFRLGILHFLKKVKVTAH